MDYILNFKGEEVELPKYSFTIANKLEKQEDMNVGNASYQDKCKGMYNVVADIIGKEKIKGLIGTFLQCDPNEINILYLKVLETYNAPLNDFNMQRTNEMIDNANIESLKELLVTAEKAAKLKLND